MGFELGSPATEPDDIPMSHNLSTALFTFRDTYQGLSVIDTLI